MRYFIPIGADCTPTRILKQKNLRHLAFPFDWIVCPIDTIYKLLLNHFEGFMKNITILDSDYRMLFSESDDNMNLVVSNTKIYPVIDTTYDILFPHDFHNNDTHTINMVKDKYTRRINRLLHIINDDSNDIIFVYNDLSLNVWQKSKYNQCNIDIDIDNHTQYEPILNDIKHLYKNGNIIHINDIESYIL